MVNIQSFWKVSSVRCIEIDESPEPVVRVVFVWRRSKDLQLKKWCHLCICGRHFAVLLRVFNWKRRTVISNVAVEGRKI